MSWFGVVGYFVSNFEALNFFFFMFSFLIYRHEIHNKYFLSQINLGVYVSYWASGRKT